ncbi:MAG: M48 family metallopeptidase [Colwellia sp.]|nr:M48 family metallopeptidase [Colwellia sp.]
MLEYQLIRSKRRKTLGLQVKHGQVTVRAPYHVSSGFINTFVQQKSAWLRTKISEQQGQANFCDFSHGSCVLFLGVEHILNISIAKKPSVFISNDAPKSHFSSVLDPSSFQQPCPQQAHSNLLKVVISERVNAKLKTPLAKEQLVKKQLEKYFKQQAERLITERVHFISNQTTLTPTKIKIRQYKARWGSCNNRGEVSFNYLLMMTPLAIIDYVIIHELCHLEYLDHSRNFWKLVEKQCPGYKTAKQWLASNQAQLLWIIPS